MRGDKQVELLEPAQSLWVLAV